MASAIVRSTPQPRWQRHRSQPWHRQWEISQVVCQLLVRLLWDQVRGRRSPHHHHRQAQWLVQQLLELGPTFIKIGQALSTRPDLLPLEYIQELSQLQDRVPAFPGEEAIAVIEADLGQPLASAYREFNPQPIASASLGQVHLARLHSGEAVVVKVQRPGLAQLIDLDRRVLHRVIQQMDRWLPGAKKYELQAIYQEFFDLLDLEIDYLHEARNADRFRENFRKQQQIIVPKVYWRYTTRRILTMEYVPGIKIDDRQTLIAQQIDTDGIIRLGICAYLQQLLQDGFFQSDPHPGNMAVSADGRLIFYDFGTMAEVHAMAKDQMMRTLFAVIRKDTDEVVETLIYMGLIEPKADMTPVKRMVAFMLEKFRDKPIDIHAFEQISGEMYLMFEQQPFRLPPQMTFIIKSLTTLDGIARALNPQYNLLAAAQPFIKSLALQGENGNLLGTMVQQTRNYLNYRRNQPDRTELAIRELEAKLETGELQIRVRAMESDRTLRRIYLGLKTLVYTCAAGFAGLATIFVWPLAANWGIALGCFTAFLMVLWLRSWGQLILRERLDRLIKP